MSDEPSKCTNYLKIVKLLVDVGTETVRSLFYHFKPRDRVTVFFQSLTICDELAVLKRQNRLSREQYNRLIFDPNPDPEEFDLALLLTLITNLFKPTIDGPIHGWDKQVAEDDTTLGAELLRLKDIRNKVVGHRPNAKLLSEEFEELWKQSKRVLIRITEFFDSTKKGEIASKIDECKTSSLDETSEIKYLSLLKTWHDEAITLLSHLQNEVEMLCKKAEGFDIFFASKIPERFLRYILLLCEGGLLVLAGIMKRELEKHQTSISDILLQNKDTLVEYNESATSVIFSADDNLVVTDISLWGTKLLSYVILMLFHSSLTAMEQTAVAGIGSASHDYGKVAMESLDSDKFRSRWADIVFNINILSNGLDHETRLESMMLIKKHDTEQVDETTAKQYLMQLRKNCEPLHSLVEQYIDLREKLKDAVEQMQREGACFGKDQVIELKMMTFGKTEEKKELAENILYTVWQTAVHNTGGSTDFTTVKAEVDLILQGVKGIRGIKKVDVEKRCIILKLVCASFEAILNLLDLFEKPLLRRFMVEASHELSSHCKEKVVVTAFITAESMQATLESLGNEYDCGTTSNVRLKLGCSSVDAIENVRDLLQRNETTNSINQMAQALSDQLNEKISISTSLVAGGVSDIYSNPLIPISQSPWTQFVLPSDTGVPDQLPDFSHLHHLRSVLDELKDFKPKGAIRFADEDHNWLIMDLETMAYVGPRSPQSTSEDITFMDDVTLGTTSPVDSASFEQPPKPKHVAGLAVNWDEYDISEKQPKMSQCSFLRSSIEQPPKPKHVADPAVNRDEYDIPKKKPIMSPCSSFESSFEQPPKPKHVAGPAVNWDEYDISEKRPRMSQCSFLGSSFKQPPKPKHVADPAVNLDEYDIPKKKPIMSPCSSFESSFEQPPKPKHVAGPAVNWEEYDISEKRPRMSQCSSLGSSFAQPPKPKHVADPAVNLDEYDIPKKKPIMSPCSSFESSFELPKPKHFAGPAVNWDEYDIPKTKPRESPCSSFGSFASIASNHSVMEDFEIIKDWMI